MSKKNVLRGIHYDSKTWKLINLNFGTIFQVAVDLRVNSPSYLKFDSFKLDHNKPLFLLLPPGIGNAFYVQSKFALYSYSLSYKGKYFDINDQKMLNKIHAIFEENHGKLDEWKLNPLFQNKSDSFRKNLSEINQFVHACEVIGGSKKIRIAWFNIPKEKKFTNDDYKLFTNKRNFGSLYHMYCDVGKPLEDLAVDNDDHHHDIVPHLHFSSDCVVHFQTDTDDDVKKMEENIESYKIANKDFLNSKGYFENDPRLTTGRIELGKLETELTQEQILNELKNYNHIQNFILT